MAGGWTRDGAIQDQIDASVASAVSRARSRLPAGGSYRYCVECEEEIPAARRRAIPGVQRCVACQAALDKRDVDPGLFNRRANKDSQLK